MASRLTLLLCLVVKVAISQNHSEYSRSNDSLAFSEFSHKIEKLPKSVLSTNPMSMLLSSEIAFFTSEYRLVGEFVTGQKSSLLLGLSYMGMGPILAAAINQDTSMKQGGYNSQNFTMTGFRLQLGYRFYFLKKGIGPNHESYNPATFGFYIFPRLSYSKAEFYLTSQKSDRLRIQFYNASLNTGYQFLVGKHLVFDVFVGAGYKNNQILEINGSSTSQMNDPEIEESFLFGSPLKINIGSAIGIAF